jgi:hypothetical protein
MLPTGVSRDPDLADIPQGFGRTDMPTRRYRQSTTSFYFSLRTPLKEPPLFLAAVNWPVFVSRFVHIPVLGLRTCERLDTEPCLYDFPVFLAMCASYQS